MNRTITPESTTCRSQVGYIRAGLEAMSHNNSYVTEGVEGLITLPWAFLRRSLQEVLHINNKRHNQMGSKVQG
jgi:hypothetical protein